MTPTDPKEMRTTLRPATGSRLTVTPMGTAVANAWRVVGFNHPFKPFLTGMGLRFTRGELDGFEPRIGGVPMSGGGGKPPPVLELKASVVDPATLESWAVLTCEPDEDGNLTDGDTVKIVHLPTLEGINTGAVAGTPLALIVWRENHPAMVWPIAFFNLRYAHREPAPGMGARTHFFL